MIKNIENIELQFLTLDDYKALKAAMIQAYASMPDAYWAQSRHALTVGDDDRLDVSNRPILQ